MDGFGFTQNLKWASEDPTYGGAREGAMHAYKAIFEKASHQLACVHPVIPMCVACVCVCAICPWTGCMAARTRGSMHAPTRRSSRRRATSLHALVSHVCVRACVCVRVCARARTRVCVGTRGEGGGAHGKLRLPAKKEHTIGP